MDVLVVAVNDVSTATESPTSTYAVTAAVVVDKSEVAVDCQ